MKFTVDRDELAEAVTWVARALPSRPVVPVLTGLLLSAGQHRENGDRNESGWLTLSCFDYEVSARVRVRAEVAEPGAALVPGRLLVEIVRSLPGYPVEFADDPDGLSVTCGEAAFTVTPLPAGEYPDLPDLPHLAGTVDGGVLSVAIGQVTPATSRDDTLPMLTAVNLELAGETLTLAATDRYRLAVRELPWHPAPRLVEQAEGAPAGAGQPRTALLVPARTLTEAARMMTPDTQVRVMLSPPGGTSLRDAPAASAAVTSDARDDSPGEDPRLSLGREGMIGFEVGQRRLTTRLLAGEFVKYRSRFPEEFGCTADLPAASFADAVRRVSLVAERGTPVQLTFAPGRVTVAAATQGQARARETVAADFTGTEPSIAFSPQYLLDGIAAAVAETHANATSDGGGADGGDGETGAPATSGARSGRVRLRFTSPSKPAVITVRPGPDGVTSFRYLVVPQRVAVLPGERRPYRVRRVHRPRRLVVEPVSRE